MTYVDLATDSCRARHGGHERRRPRPRCSCCRSSHEAARSILLSEMPTEDRRGESHGSSRRVGEVPRDALSEARSSRSSTQLQTGEPRSAPAKAVSSTRRIAAPGLARSEDRREGHLSRSRRRSRRRRSRSCRRSESENLLTFIQDEHPQTISLIVSAPAASHGVGDPRRSAGARSRSRSCAASRTWSRRIPTSSARSRAVSKSRLSNMLMPLDAEKVGGVETVAEMLNLCDRTTEKAILEGIEGGGSGTSSKQIRRLMFVFEDILLVNDKGIQSVLKESRQRRAHASRSRRRATSSRRRCFANMSARAAELIQARTWSTWAPVRV